MNSIKIVAFIFGAMVLTACGSSGSTTDEIKDDTGENQSPIVNAGTDKTVTVNEIVTLTGNGTDSDGTIVSYEWKKSNKVLGTESTLIYIPTVVGTDTLTLTVTDDDGANASDIAEVTVEAESDDDSDFGDKK